MPTPGQKAKLKQILKDSGTASQRLEELDEMKRNLNKLKSIQLLDAEKRTIGTIDEKLDSLISDISDVIEQYLDLAIDALFADAETTRKEANP